MVITFRVDVNHIMKKINFCLAISLLAVLSAFSQNQNQIDSLKNELEKYDAHKTERGLNTVTLADTFKVEIYGELWSSYLNNNKAEALKYAQNMTALSEQIGYKKGMADGYIRIGLVCDENGNYPEAIKNNLAAIHIQEEIKDTMGLSQSYINLGVVFSKQSNFPEALKYLEMATAISELQNDDYGLGVGLSNIGIIYKLQMKYTEALVYYTKAKAFFEKSNEAFGVVACMNNIGDIYVLQNKLPEAIAIFKKALNVKIEGDYLKASSYNSLVKAYLKKADYDTAMAYANLAFELRKKMEDKYGLALTQIQFGEIYQKKGNVTLAITNVSEGLKIAEEIGEIEFIKNGHKLLSEMYKSVNNYKEAFYHQVLFKQFNDSIFNTEKEKKFTELQMTYHFEKVQDSLITQHSKEVALSAVEIKTQKKIRNYFLFGMALIIVLLIVSIYQRNKISLVKKQQAVALERTRISQDLHDDLGSGLAGIMMLSEQIQFRENKELQTINIERIKTTSRNMIEQLADIVWAMNSKNDSLENLIRYTQNYVQEFFENQPIQLILVVPENIENFELNGLTRRNILLVIKETLTNIYKHAQATIVNFEIAVNAKEVFIDIDDNGKGFDVTNTRRFGNGIKNMKSRMNAINGAFDLASNNGNKTTTRISFKIVNQIV